MCFLCLAVHCSNKKCFVQWTKENYPNWKKKSSEFRVNFVTEFRVNEVDLKHVFHIEARVFNKRAIVLVSALGQKTNVKPPSYVSFKLASENIQIAQSIKL